ncbi:MAG: type II toxin-antitoxin system RelE/ParE family toxin [Myxacorys californica WJT36-NPBG1]|jgi:mRNA interferase RelE/StbE|nr:type II toxin-antitoxin system RelE/ParE family toxin [Myxacorys californica WJT36-NPBG1]
MYEVVLSANAEALYIKLDLATAKKVSRCFIHLEQNPRIHPNIKPLKGDFSGIYRFRTGDYRVLYAIDDETKIVSILTIKHRSEAYD